MVKCEELLSCIIFHPPLVCLGCGRLRAAGRCWAVATTRTPPGQQPRLTSLLPASVPQCGGREAAPRGHGPCPKAHTPAFRRHPPLTTAREAAGVTSLRPRDAALTGPPGSGCLRWVWDLSWGGFDGGWLGREASSVGRGPQGSWCCRQDTATWQQRKGTVTRQRSSPGRLFPVLTRLFAGPSEEPASPPSPPVGSPGSAVCSLRRPQDDQTPARKFLLSREAGGELGPPQSRFCHKQECKMNWTENKNRCTS